MLNCPNVRCQAVNHLDDKFCQVCGTPLGRRYLWILGVTMTAQRIGETIGDRYLVVQPRLLLDTQPATPPETPEDFPPEIASYLRLFNQRLHIPQVYGMVLDSTPLWLLEGVPMIGECLAPELTTVWSEASPLRQLSWLRQIVALWEPLHYQGVSASLLHPELVRVNGSLVKLLELRSNNDRNVGLPDLGQHWLTLVQPQSLMARFLEELATQLITGSIADAPSLLATLEGGIRQCRDAVRHQYQVLTATDKGPTREGNEDACYPAPGVVKSLQEGLLAIVCDGIGGHEGGEVASGLAIATVVATIATIQAQVEQIQPKTIYTAPEIEQKLEAAVRGANDVISDRNDQEQRQSRQRMGTTLVMAWSQAYELYLSHVGDSRAYWITLTGCYQITLDDDIASREVCLGYALYRETLKYPSSGSLVQALGMTSSTNLYPTVQRFIPDESGIFLLCSDGLSDYDRVEQNWESLILPCLRGENSLSQVMANLINLANTQNGHDNVTVALIYCQVTLTALPAPLVFHKILAPVSTNATPIAAPVTPIALLPLKVQKTVELPKRRRIPYVVGLVTIVLAGGLGVWAAIQVGLINPFSAANNSPTSSPTATLDPKLSSKPTPIPSGLTPKNSPPVISQQLSVEPGDRLKLTSPLLLPLTKNPNQRVELPINTIVQVIKQTASPNQEKLVELTVCLLPTSIANPDSNNSPVSNQIGNVTIPTQSLASVIDLNYPKSSSGAIGSCGSRSNS